MPTWPVTIPPRLICLFGSERSIADGCTFPQARLRMAGVGGFQCQTRPSPERYVSQRTYEVISESVRDPGEVEPRELRTLRQEKKRGLARGPPSGKEAGGGIQLRFARSHGCREGSVRERHNERRTHPLSERIVSCGAIEASISNPWAPQQGAPSASTALRWRHDVTSSPMLAS